jgi:hypothetical protein
MYAACVTGALGLFSRASFALLTVTAAYVLLIPQLGGAVFHDHHLLWFAALLAASPCGDALSVDAWRARRRGASPPDGGPAHGLALRFAWLFVGLIYFFPAVHKLEAMGLDWALSDNLRHQLWWKWAQDPTLLPRLRIDRVPWLVHTLAGLTLLFELSFVGLVFVRRTRLLAVAAALAFHAGTHLLMGIDFSVLYACYTVFLPWSGWLARVRETAPYEPPLIAPLAVQPAMHTLITVGALLVTGIVTAGRCRGHAGVSLCLLPHLRVRPRAQHARAGDRCRPHGRPRGALATGAVPRARAARVRSRVAPARRLRRLLRATPARLVAGRSAAGAAPRANPGRTRGALLPGGRVRESRRPGRGERRSAPAHVARRRGTRHGLMPGRAP